MWSCHRKESYILEMEKLDKIVLAGLLHDIGKVLSKKQSDGISETVDSEFLKEAGIDEEIIESCLYNDFDSIEKANLSKDSIAYIVLFSKLIALTNDAISGKTENKSDNLNSIFSYLNGHNHPLEYNSVKANGQNKLVFPEEKSNVKYNFINDVSIKLRNDIKNIEDTSVDSWMSLIENSLSYIPSMCNGDDISFYDHAKVTAALCECVYCYLSENNIQDYDKFLFKDYKNALNEKMFVLASFDTSGIQKFIYNINTSGALKQLRARSMYLELLCENLVFEILKSCGLHRTSVIYNGGGHAYIIMPNTQSVKENFKKIVFEQNEFLMDKFREKLYVAGDCIECTGNELGNRNTDGNFDENNIFGNLIKNLTRKISKNKLQRYTYSQIQKLNDNAFESSNECSVCGTNIKNGKCICSYMTDLGKDLFKNDCLVFAKNKIDEGLNLDFYSNLSGISYLNLMNKEELYRNLHNDSFEITNYLVKNDFSSANRILVSDYFAKDKFNNPKDFEDFADEALGISRIALLRADVDNLGMTFKNGFDKMRSSLVRFSALSKMLTRFFKYNINEIIEQDNGLVFEPQNVNNVSIIYSGGDDICLVGSWNDVIENALKIRNTFKKFCGGRLSISAGIGIYKNKYPVSRMATQVGELEDTSKQNKEGNKEKDSITLFSDDYSFTFFWDDFETKVVNEKLKPLTAYFSKKSELGNSFIYNLIFLLRGGNDRKAQLAYTLARMIDENDKIGNESLINKLYEWSKDEKSRKELVAALVIYIYTIREKTNGQQ